MTIQENARVDGASAVRHSLSLVKLLRVRQAFLRRQDVCRPLGSTLLLRGDALDSLRLMPDAIVDSEVSSPPYWMQRDYQSEGQIGRERTSGQYLRHLWDVYEEMKRVLRDDGTCWVNIGDTCSHNSCQLIPERFVDGMKKMGWLVRDKIIWRKTNCRPESVRTRFTRNWEPVYLFTKSARYYFRPQYQPYAKTTLKRCRQAVDNGERFNVLRHKQDPLAPTQAPMAMLIRFAKNICIPGQVPNSMHVRRACGFGQDVFAKEGANMRAVWDLPTARYPGAHFATFSPKLLERIIRAGCRPGGVVLDAFVGVGTSCRIANSLGCAAIGIDISRDYLAMAEEGLYEDGLTCVPTSPRSGKGR